MATAFRFREGIMSILFLLTLATFLNAQVRTSGDIRGKIFDPGSAIIPGVSLEIKDLATGEVRTAISDELGAFVFLNLQSGAYQLTASLPGFQTSVYPRVVVETARTTDIEVRLTVGSLAESVQVTADAPVLETTSTTISSTVRNTYIQNLPISGRSTLPFAALMAGAQTPGTGTRDSTFNGLPNASMQITIDGMNNNSQRWKSGGTSFFGFAPSRLDAIEEVTVSTTGSGADLGAGGAMTIRMTTKRGANEFHGKVFYQLEHDALNANSFFDNTRGLAKSKERNHDFGGNLGGWLPVPWTSKRVYFFLNFEANPAPVTNIEDQEVLTPDAQRGVFRYIGTDGLEKSANLLEIAGRGGFPGTVDPAIQRMLNLINGTLSQGTLLPSVSDLNRVTLQWRQKDYSAPMYPTARLDYQITPKLAWHGTWNLRANHADGVPVYPGLDAGNKRQLWTGENWITTYVASNVLDWTVTPSMLNSFTFGVQSNNEFFSPSASIFVWRDEGIPRLSFPTNTMTSPIPGGTQNPRNNPVYSVSDNLSWMRGKHTFNFGGSLMYITFYNTSWGSAGVPTYNLGVVASDPVTSVLSGTNLPGIRSSDVTAAWNLYAALTGRLSSVTGSRNVDELSKQYLDFVPRIPRQAFLTGGFYFQDAYRATSNLTLNYGLRWELSGAHYNTNGIYVDPGIEHLMGPSRQLFAPGVLDGVLDPQLYQKSRAYTSDKINPAPNFGFAWNPSFDNRNLVIRGAYGINFYDEGSNTILNGVGGNPGGTQSIDLRPGMPGFTPGGLSLSSPLPPFAVNPAAFVFPMAQSNYTFINDLNTTKPRLRTPYVQNWTLGIQREIAPTVVVEARYVGNKSTHIWRTYRLSETNIFENGFLREFVNAQKNLEISRAAGVSSFANRGLPGQVPLPIFEAAFGARGSQPALASGSAFTSGTFINHLQRGTAGAMADTMAQGSANIYLCRMAGSSFPPCRTLGFDAAGPYPMNFFRHNPYVTNTELLDDNSWGTYHGLQLEMRKSFSNGLTLNANYVWSKSLGDYFDTPDSDNSSDYATLRNRGLNKAPSPFDLRHSFTTYWSFQLPFGRGQRYLAGGNAILDRIVGGWTISGIHRWNSGRVFRLTSGRGTFNQFESGVILNGLTQEEVQKKIRQFSSGPNFNAYHVDPSLVGPDGRANPQFFQVPTTPGELGHFIHLYGTPLVLNDMAMTKEIRLTERSKFTLQAEATNVFNHPVLGIGGLGGGLNIDSTSFGQTSSTLVGARSIQMRAHITW